MDQTALGFCYKTGHFDILLVISIFLLYYDIGDNLEWISTPWSVVPYYIHPHTGVYPSYHIQSQVFFFSFVSST